MAVTRKHDNRHVVKCQIYSSDYLDFVKSFFGSGNDPRKQWSPGKPGNSITNADEHFKKHGHQFGVKTAKEYASKATQFFRTPHEGTQVKTRSNGDKIFYHPDSNTFGVVNNNGQFKTMFKPDNGIQYFNRQ